MWYLLVSDFLREIGFLPMAVDLTIFRQTELGVIIRVYVNNFMIIRRNKAAIKKVKGQLKRRFKIKDLVEAKNILRIRIQRYKGKLTIN